MATDPDGQFRLGSRFPDVRDCGVDTLDYRLVGGGKAIPIIKVFLQAVLLMRFLLGMVMVLTFG